MQKHNPNDDTIATNVDHSLNQLYGRTNPLWILLDNQLTVDVFYNGKLLQNIHHAKNGITIFSTERNTTTHMKGELPGYGEVWYHPEGISNILPLYWVASKYQVQFDSVNGN